MTAQEILKEMKPLGRESYKKLLFKNYGVKEPCFGVRISDLKKIQKVTSVPANSGADAKTERCPGH